MDDMNDKRVKNNESSGNLLEPQEKLILEQIAAGEPPHSQRAHSLLAIDAGVTQKIAALQSGQTVGQVSYWLSKFRREGMALFPEEILRQSGYEPPPPLQLPGQLTPSGGSEIDQQVEGDVSEEDFLSPAAEAKPEQIEGKKVKSEQDKASKNVKKEKNKIEQRKANMMKINNDQKPVINLDHGRNSSVDLETIIEQIWKDLGGIASRSDVRSVVIEIAPRYADARFFTYVPILMGKEVRSRLLRRV